MSLWLSRWLYLSRYLYIQPYKCKNRRKRASASTHTQKNTLDEHKLRTAFIQTKQSSPERESSKQEVIYFELAVKSEGKMEKWCFVSYYCRMGGWQQGRVPPPRCEHTSGIWMEAVLMMRNMREEGKLLCCSTQCHRDPRLLAHTPTHTHTIVRAHLIWKYL